VKCMENEWDSYSVVVEELKRRVEELERRLVEVCPGPCRCPYRNRLITGDNRHMDQLVDPWAITYY
jgi:hypothetical protein